MLRIEHVQRDADGAHRLEPLSASSPTRGRQFKASLLRGELPTNNGYVTADRPASRPTSYVPQAIAIAFEALNPAGQNPRFASR
jgi:hypothetical protein